MANWWKGRRILVTGGTGFLGSHLVGSLKALGAELYLCVRKQADTFPMDPLRADFCLLPGDLCDFHWVKEAVREARPEVVFHLAAAGVNPGAAAPHTVVETNVMATLNLLEAVRDRDLARFVYVGSGFEYGGGVKLREDQALAPTGVYAASKAAGGLLCQAYHRAHGLPAVMLRPFTPYGPGERRDRLIPHVILCALQSRDIPMTGGEQERDFVYVDDVIQGLLLAVSVPGAVGATINLCSGVGTPIRQAVEQILSLMDHPVRPLLGAIPYRPGEMWKLSGDPTRAREILGWSPRVGLDTGLRRAIHWFRDHA